MRLKIDIERFNAAGFDFNVCRIGRITRIVLAFDAHFGRISSATIVIAETTCRYRRVGCSDGFIPTAIVVAIEHIDKYIGIARAVFIEVPNAGSQAYIIQRAATVVRIGLKLNSEFLCLAVLRIDRRRVVCGRIIVGVSNFNACGICVGFAVIAEIISRVLRISGGNGLVPAAVVVAIERIGIATVTVVALNIYETRG